MSGTGAYRKTSWHESALSMRNGEYHLISDGILTRNDYTLLFEKEDGKVYLPIEAVTQLNIYSDVKISPKALSLLSDKGICICFFNAIGNLEGSYTPMRHTRSTSTLLNQCRLYENAAARLALAQSFENASCRNMLAALRYYSKSGRNDFAAQLTGIEQALSRIKTRESINALMICEAKARRAYYSAFDSILSSDYFTFNKRSKRPPENEVNAMISFGNAMIYNKFLQLIWRTGLDPRIGVVHASTERMTSLNLDFADVYKPVIVDRTIFSLVNKREISASKHFRREGHAVLLNDEGKKLFVTKINNKLASALTVKGQRKTYEQLMADDVHRFKEAIKSGEAYAPSRFR